jgi:hypothetical protein
MSPTINTMASNNSSIRSQEGNNGSEQITNPFDVGIKKPKFPSIFED